MNHNIAIKIGLSSIKKKSQFNASLDLNRRDSEATLRLAHISVLYKCFLKSP